MAGNGRKIWQHRELGSALSSFGVEPDFCPHEPSPFIHRAFLRKLLEVLHRRHHLGADEVDVRRLSFSGLKLLQARAQLLQLAIELRNTPVGQLAVVRGDVVEDVFDFRFNPGLLGLQAPQFFGRLGPLLGELLLQRLPQKLVSPFLEEDFQVLTDDLQDEFLEELLADKAVRQTALPLVM